MYPDRTSYDVKVSFQNWDKVGDRHKQKQVGLDQKQNRGDSPTGNMKGVNVTSATGERTSDDKQRIAPSVV